MAAPITFHRAHCVEALVDVLARDLAADRRAGASVLAPRRLLLPSPGLDTYLRRALARRDGIAASLTTSYPQAFVAETLQQALPGVALLERQHVLCALIALMHDEHRLADDPQLAPVRRYLATAADDGDARDRRRVQLAAELEQLFDEYSFTRPDMLREWRSEKPARAGSDAEWQRRLWQLVLEQTAPREDLPSAVARLPELASGPIHVIGFANLPPLVLEILRQVSATATVRVYALAPALPAPAAPSAAAGAGPRWGAPAQEGVALMAEAFGIAAPESIASPVPEQATLLGALQNELGNSPHSALGGAAAFVPDDTVLVLASPSPTRELEAIAAEIWNLLRQDRGLRLSDIAVVLPSAARDELLPELESVFAAERLPWRVVDRSLRTPATALQAADLLLALPLGGLTRPDVLRLVSHPAVLARLPDVAPERWFELCDRLGVIRGAAAGDDAAYLQHDVLSWEQGLRRLGLGALLARPAPGEPPEPYLLASAPHLPAGLSPDERSDALVFALLVRSLLADARAAVAEPAPLGRHLAFMRALLSSYLAGVDEADELALAEAQHALVRLEDAAGSAGTVSYRVACEVARRALQAIASGRGGHADGVQVSSFVALRGVPAKVRFLCGLDEGVFPSGRPPRALDVRAADPRRGDVSARQQDEMLFLDALLSTRQRVVLSYRGRDALTGDRREPAPVVGELLDLLAERMGAEAAGALCRTIPLHRFDDERTVAESAPAAAEACALRLGRGPHVEPPAVTGGDRPAEALGTASISISTLTAFLVCPPQGWARALLRMSSDLDIDDVLAREEELLASGSLAAWNLRRNAWLQAARVAGRTSPDRQSLVAAYDRLVELERLAGRAPGGPFGEAERSSDLEILKDWSDTLRQLPLEGGVVPGVVDIGRGRPSSRREDVLPSLALEVVLPDTGGRVRVELHGQTGIVQRGDEWITSLDLATVTDNSTLPRARLRATIDHVLLSAAGAAAGMGHRLVQCRPEGKHGGYEWSPMPQDEARRYLTSLLQEMLSPTPPSFLPLEAALELHRSAERPIAEVVAGLRERNRRQPYPGPLPDPEATGLPDDGEARALIERRLAPFFAARKDGEP